LDKKLKQTFKTLKSLKPKHFIFKKTWVFVALLFTIVVTDTGVKT